MNRRRYALVGAGARAQMFVRALVTDHADHAELVALADVNPVRIAAHNRWLNELGAPPAASWTPDELGRAATERDGATSLLVGLAGNESMRTGAPVRVADLLEIEEPRVR